MSPSLPDITVRTRGLSWQDIQIQLVVAGIAVPLQGAFILLLTNGGPSHDTTVKLVVWALTVAISDLLLETILSLRAVRVDTSGVTFSYPFRTYFASWSDLIPSNETASHGVWVVFQQESTGGRRAHTVTSEQARAILAWPHRPDWPVSRPVLESLHVSVNLQPGPGSR